MSIRELFSQPGDRRRSPRMRPEVLAAYYWTGAVPRPHPVFAIGVYGAHILGSESFYPGTVIELILEEPGSRHICVYGRVLRNVEGGFCVEFVFGDVSERRRLRQFLDSLKRRGGNEIGTKTTAIS